MAMMRLSVLVIVSSVFAASSALVLRNPYSQYSHSAGRQGLEVDLGYARYEGQTNGNISTWFGVRFGAPTGGSARFQAPQVPAKPVGTPDLITGNQMGDACAQYFWGNFMGSEDCLFLNVYAPENAENLPVFVFIHGGAYQAGMAGGSDPTDLIINNNNRFIAVMIQYRLGVFGFLGTEETKRRGQLNAGLLDMELALEWVQNYAHLFGGDPRRVTVSGESAGGGAVMLMSILRGGELKERLFQQIIGASPYLPKQFHYDGSAPRILYNNISAVLGCNNSHDSFACLVNIPTQNLTAVGYNIDNDPRYSQFIWGFVPVTDGEILRDVPSQSFLRRPVNGKRLLIGYNSNEGATFVPTDIETEQDFDNYMNRYLPYVSSIDKEILKQVYPTTHDTNSSMLLYDTNGYNEQPNANSLSDWNNGQQQRAFNMLAEALFMCPTYWMANAFEQAWKYEFAVSPAYHSYDTQAYFFANQTHPAFTDDFVLAFQNIWGNFIVNGDPQISHSLACGSLCSTTTANTDVTHWPAYTRWNPSQMIVNTTSSHVGTCQLFLYALRCAVGPDLQNNFTLVNAREWQAGRGDRCDLWQRIGPSVPE